MLAAAPTATTTPAPTRALIVVAFGGGGVCSCNRDFRSGHNGNRGFFRLMMAWFPAGAAFPTSCLWTTFAGLAPTFWRGNNGRIVNIGHDFVEINGRPIRLTAALITIFYAVEMIFGRRQIFVAVEFDAQTVTRLDIRQTVALLIEDIE
ncbi:MAG: hypothetical protein ABL897_07930, partial [Hyphomicrobium sp.]